MSKFNIGDRIVYEIEPKMDQFTDNFNGKGIITHVNHPSYRVVYDKFNHMWLGYDEMRIDIQYYREERLKGLLG